MKNNIKTKQTSIKKLILPTVSLGAEHLVMGYLMRRNILTYKAPPNNAGYDLICVHPDSTNNEKKVIKVQVKSRFQIDCDKSFMIQEESFGNFDYLILVFQNIGSYYRKNKLLKNSIKTLGVIEFYTLPKSYVKKHYSKHKSRVGKLNTKNLNMENYKDELGFEQIANDLLIKYPNR